MKPRFVKLSAEWEAPFKAFLDSLQGAGDHRHFQPHPFTDEAVKQRVAYKGKDLYFLLVDEERVLGYGMLRGWDEGYSRPSLGIAVHPDERGKGWARKLMKHLHGESRRRGAKEVRLRVRKDNAIAIDLYQDLGYRLRPDQDPSFWEGILEL